MRPRRQAAASIVHSPPAPSQVECWSEGVSTGRRAQTTSQSPAPALSPSAGGAPLARHSYSLCSSSSSSPEEESRAKNILNLGGAEKC